MVWSLCFTIDCVVWNAVVVFVSSVRMALTVADAYASKEAKDAVNKFMAWKSRQISYTDVNGHIVYQLKVGVFTNGSTHCGIRRSIQN